MTVFRSMESGKLFQTRDATTWNARSLMYSYVLVKFVG